MQFNLVSITNRRALSATVLGLNILVFCACAGPLYTVAPLPKSPPAAMAGSATGGLDVSARGLSDELAMAQFDANLPLAGLIAVEIRLTNRTGTAIAGSSLRLSLSDSTGKAMKPIAPKKALGRVMKYYGVTLYGKEAYARTLESYEAIALRLDQNLSPSDGIMGIVFFDVRTPVVDLAGYRLQIEGGPAPISLQLN